MEPTQQTPVGIIQELIAIHTTRKEALARIQENAASADLAGVLESGTIQSDAFIAELLTELSRYGDAVQADVDRTNSFHTIWNEALPAVKTMNPTALSQTFHQLEDSLKSTYADLAASGELPESLKEIITKQAAQLG